MALAQPPDAMEVDAADAAFITLRISGTSRAVQYKPNDTVAALYAAVEGDLAPETIKMLYRGRKLAPSDGIPRGDAVTIVVMGTSREDRSAAASAVSDPLTRGFARRLGREADRKSVV